MMLKKSVVLIAALYLSIGCKVGRETSARKYEIKLHHLDNSIHLVRPIDLEYMGSWLVWQDHYEGKYYSGYQLHDRKFVRFAKVGKGKDEFSMWPMGSISPFGLGLFNNETKTYRTWNVDSTLNDANYFPFDSMPITDSLQSTFTMIQRRDSSFISTGPNERGLLSFFGKNGELLNISGDYPEKQEGVSSKIHSVACLNSTYTFHPGMDRFVIGYLFSGRFEVFQLQGNQAILQWKEDKFPFKYNVADGRVRIPISTKYGYVDLDCTDNYIYALYSGKSREEDYFPTYSTVIEVYNWNGEQVAELELNTPVGQIAISSDNKYIYGAGLEDNVIGLFQAELPVL